MEKKKLNFFSAVHTCTIVLPTWCAYGNKDGESNYDRFRCVYCKFKWEISDVHAASSESGEEFSLMSTAGTLNLEFVLIVLQNLGRGGGGEEWKLTIMAGSNYDGLGFVNR